MNQTSNAASTTKTACTPTLIELERDRASGAREYELPRDEDGLFVCLYQNCEAPIRLAERTEAAFFAHLAAHDARNDRLLVGVVARANAAQFNASVPIAAPDASTLASLPRAPSPPFTVARRRAQVAAARAAGVDLPPLPHRSRFSLASLHSLPAPTASHAASPALPHRVQSAPSAHRASSNASALASPHSLLDDDAANAAAKKSRRIDVTLHGYDLPILKQVGDGERIQLKCPLGNCPKVIQGFIYHLHSHLMAHRRAEGKGEPLVIRKDRQLDVKAKALAARAAAAANAASTPTAPSTSTLALRLSASDDNHLPTHNATTPTAAAAAAARASAALAIKSTLLTKATTAALAPRLHATASNVSADNDDDGDDDHLPRGDRRHHAVPTNVANANDDDVDDDTDVDDDARSVDATAPTGAAAARRSHAETDNNTATATNNNDDDYDRDDRDESDDDDGGDEDASVAAARRRVATLKRKALSSASPGVSHVTPDTVLIFCDDPRWRPLSERADLLREFIGKYGVGLFRQNLSGDFLCFFHGCGAMMLQNFSRHLTRHERDSTPIDPALQLVADEFHRQRGSSLLPDGS